MPNFDTGAVNAYWNLYSNRSLKNMWLLLRSFCVRWKITYIHKKHFWLGGDNCYIIIAKHMKYGTVGNDVSLHIFWKPFLILYVCFIHDVCGMNVNKGWAKISCWSPVGHPLGNIKWELFTQAAFVFLTAEQIVRKSVNGYINVWLVNGFHKWYP